MITVFADSFFFFALGNIYDPAHRNAVAFSQSYTGQLITTDFVLVEVADGCAGTAHRREMAVQIVRELRENPNVVIVPCSQELLAEGLQLFAQRSDKSSLSPTVCPFW